MKVLKILKGSLFESRIPHLYVTFGRFVKMCTPSSWRSAYGPVLYWQCYIQRICFLDRMADVYPDDLQHTRYPLLTDAQCAADPLVDEAGGIDADTNVCAGFPDDYYLVTCSVCIY